MQIQAFICNIQLVNTATGVHRTGKQRNERKTMSYLSTVRLQMKNIFPSFSSLAVSLLKRHMLSLYLLAGYVRFYSYSSISVLGDLDGLSFSA